MNIIKGRIKSAIKTVIYGPEGIGKSTLASHFPEPLFIDTEGSTSAMDVARTPSPSSWTMLTEQVKYVRDNPELCKTLVIDTADWAEKLCTSHICAQKKVDGIEGIGYGKGYVYLEEEFGRLLNLLKEVIERGIHVVLTAHAQMRKFEQPDEMGAYDRWELKLSKKVAPMVKEWADMVLFANYKTYVINVDGQGTDKGRNKAQGGKRVMYTTHHNCWDAKNRYNLPEEVPFEWLSIAHVFAAPTEEVVAPTTKASNIATEDRYFVHLQSCSYFIVAKGEKLPDFDGVKEVTKEQHDTAIYQESIINKPKDPPKTFNTVKPPEKSPETVPDEYEGVPKALQDLMKQNFVSPIEIQEVVAKRGYFPKNTPIQNYPADFVSGVLVGAWPQVFAMIQENKKQYEIPFK